MYLFTYYSRKKQIITTNSNTRRPLAFLESSLCHEAFWLVCQILPS